MSDKTLHLSLLSIVYLALIISALHPFDVATWCMEVFPVFIATPVLIATYKNFKFTNLLYCLIAIHALILILGGAYSYARVPLGFWLQDFFELSRNPYDKIGHFAQGFVPALIARELFIRKSYVTGRKMIFFLCICVAMAISASYELIEWFAAVLLGQGADEFLGTQGDVWDTQSDMFMALLGSLTGLLLLGKIQDKQIRLRKQASPV